MRALVTLLTSFILALGLLGAGLTLLHTLPRKKAPTSPGLQIKQPASLEIMPRPIEKRVEPAGPREASFKRASRGDLRLSGQILIPKGKMVALELLREGGETGLFIRRLDLGTQRDFRFEGLTRGKYRLQAREPVTGHILIEHEIRLDRNRELKLSPKIVGLVRELRFKPREGGLQEGAILILEDGHFFHQRIRGQANGHFLAKGLPTGNLRYTIRGRLGPKTSKLLWKGSLSILSNIDAKALPPQEIKLGEAEKDAVD